jgi:hypothetical protein
MSVVIEGKEVEDEYKVCKILMWLVDIGMKIWLESLQWIH